MMIYEKHLDQYFCVHVLQEITTENKITPQKYTEFYTRIMDHLFNAFTGLDKMVDGTLFNALDPKIRKETGYFLQICTEFFDIQFTEEHLFGLIEGMTDEIAKIKSTMQVKPREVPFLAKYFNIWNKNLTNEILIQNKIYNN